MTKTIVLAVLMTVSLPVLAKANEPTTSVRVGYSDLDLTTAAGQNAFDRRLRRAIEAVCPSTNGVRDIESLAAIRRCKTTAAAQVAPARAAALATAARPFMAAAAQR